MKMNRKKQDCKEGKHFSLSKLLIPVSLVLISLSLGNILPDYLDKHNSSRTYENLRESYTKIRKGDGEEKEKDWWLTDVMIRFDELREENPDIVAWIRSDDPENTGIEVMTPISNGGLIFAPPGHSTGAARVGISQTIFSGCPPL